jgi:phenylpyruvate tautomerase PptA (4-oxalocrotonate tautomerase family)
MPFLRIETNRELSDVMVEEKMQSASAFVADLLGKPESYVMISIQAQQPLIFGGAGDPAAFITLKSIGLPLDRCAELSSAICHFMERELDVSKDRIFIDFQDAARDRFGWNGGTF